MRTAPMVSDAGQRLHREFAYTSTWARAMQHQRWSWWYRLHSKLRYAIAIIIFIPNKLVQLCREQSLPVGVNLLGKWKHKFRFKLVSAGAALSLKKFATLGRGLALRMTTVVKMICLWWRWWWKCMQWSYPWWGWSWGSWQCWWIGGNSVLFQRKLKCAARSAETRWEVKQICWKYVERKKEGFTPKYGQMWSSALEWKFMFVVNQLPPGPPSIWPNYRLLHCQLSHFHSVGKWQHSMSHGMTINFLQKMFTNISKSENVHQYIKIRKCTPIYQNQKMFTNISKSIVKNTHLMYCTCTAFSGLLPLPSIPEQLLLWRHNVLLLSKVPQSLLSLPKWWGRYILRVL